MAIESNTVECMLLRMLPNSLPPHVHESKLVLRHFPVSSVHFFLSTAEVSVKLHEVFPHCAILTQQLLTKCHFWQSRILWWREKCFLWSLHTCLPALDFKWCRV